MQYLFNNGKSFGPIIPTAFGMTMNERSFSGGNYRFGFNGKEKDNEINVDAGDYDYGFRINDVRLGRFLSVDPLTKKYAYYSPYHFAGNKPISHLDLDGLEDIYYDNPIISKSKAYSAAVELLTSTDTYKGFQKKLVGANAVDVVVAPKLWTNQIRGETVFIGSKPEDQVSTAYEDAKKSGVDLARSNNKGRDVVVIYIDKGLLDQSDKLIESLSSNPFIEKIKDDPAPLINNEMKLRKNLEVIAATIGHEQVAHTEDELDKHDDISTGQEHMQYYNDPEFYKKNSTYYSPSYEDIKPNSNAGKLKKELVQKSADITNKVIDKKPK